LGVKRSELHKSIDFDNLSELHKSRDLDKRSRVTQKQRLRLEVKSFTKKQRLT
jgi:hypothetical protein